MKFLLRCNRCHSKYRVYLPGKSLEFSKWLWVVRCSRKDLSKLNNKRKLVFPNKMAWANGVSSQQPCKSQLVCTEMFRWLTKWNFCGDGCELQSINAQFTSPTCQTFRACAWLYTLRFYNWNFSQEIWFRQKTLCTVWHLWVGRGFIREF